MQYAVQPGDSPQSIALRWTGASTRWGELVAANPHKPRARDGSFRELVPCELLNLPPSWLHGRTSASSPSSRSRPASSEASGVPEARPPRPLETRSTPEKVTWIPIKGGAYSSDLRFYRHPSNPNPNGEWWSDRAWDLWLDMAEAIGADPEVLLAVAAAESELKPWIVGRTRNAKGELVPFAWGLFQITDQRNRDAGVSDAEHRAWLAQGFAPHTAEQQIPLLRRYWETINRTPVRSGGRGGQGFGGLSAGAIYAFNFMPAHVRSGADSVILVSNHPEDADPNFPQLYWPKGVAANLSLDVNGDGRITIGELAEVIRRKSNTDLFRLAKRRLDAARLHRGRVAPISPENPITPSRPRPSPPRPPQARRGSSLMLPMLGLVGLFLALD